MPIIKSAIKRAKQAVKRREKNIGIKKDIKSAVKAFHANPTATTLAAAHSELDTAVKKGLLKKNTASRRKANLVKIAKAAKAEVKEETTVKVAAKEEKAEETKAEKATAKEVNKTTLQAKISQLDNLFVSLAGQELSEEKQAQTVNAAVELNKAKDLVASTSATQEQVDAQVAALEAAINNLNKVEKTAEKVADKKEEAKKEEDAKKEEADSKDALTEALKQLPDNELLDKKAKEELLKAVESGELNASDILAELADDAEKAQDTNPTIKTETPVSKDKLPEEVQAGIEEGEAADAARPESEKLQDKADDLTETIENLTDDAEQLKADAEKKAETLKKQEDTLKEAKEALKSAKDNGFAEDITAPLEKAVTAIEKERDTAKSEFDEADEKIQAAAAEIQDLTEKRDNLLEEVKNPKIKGLVSVTEVDVTEDLKFADTYFSILPPLNSDEKQYDNEEILEALNEIKGFLRKRVAEEVDIRFTPEIRVKLDNSMENAMKITKLLNDLKA